MAIVLKIHVNMICNMIHEYIYATFRYREYARKALIETKQQQTTVSVINNMQT